MRILRSVFIIGIPFAVAIVALGLYPLWILGIPGSPDADYAAGWAVGFFAIPVFLCLYGVGFVCLVLTWIFRWQIAGTLHALLWLLCALFVIAMAVAAWLIPW